MAHKKAGGSSKNLTTQQPKYLGTKLYGGEKAKAGNIIIRQRGSVIVAGENVKMGKDHTLFALKDGIVTFGTKRKTRFNGKKTTKKKVSVV